MYLLITAAESHVAFVGAIPTSGTAAAAAAVAAVIMI